MSERVDRNEHARGLMLGLLLADAHDEWDAHGRMHGTCLGQLACFTLEGLIRAVERGTHKGICHPPSVIWHAWCRWAHIQGLGPSFAAQWAGGATTGWPDGWLHQVRPLSIRRGDAPATVAALQRSAQLPEKADGQGAGHHALTRGLPLAILAPEGFDGPALAAEVAASTHASPLAVEAAAAGVALATAALAGDARALETATPLPGHDKPGTAPQSLCHGVAAVRSATSFTQTVEAARPHGRGAATVAGALYGALHGAGALDSWLLYRHEIAWVGDQLARDAIREVREHPSGGGFGPAEDPAWAGRYPGW
jgi:hypothetical protein